MSTDSMDSGAARELSHRRELFSRRALTPPPPAARRPRPRRSRSHSAERRHTHLTDDGAEPEPRLSSDRLLGANILLAPHPRWGAGPGAQGAPLRRLAVPEAARFVSAGRLGPTDRPTEEPLLLGWLQVQSPAVPPTGLKQMPFHRNLEHLMRL